MTKLKDAAEEWATKKYGPTCDCKDGFIAGAKWFAGALRERLVSYPSYPILLPSDITAILEGE